MLANKNHEHKLLLPELYKLTYEKFMFFKITISDYGSSCGYWLYQVAALKLNETSFKCHSMRDNGCLSLSN